VPPPINNAAGGDAAPYEQGLRVAFASGHFDLSPQTADAITGLARSLASRDTVTLELRAYAAPVADDPSTPRRLALSRALAIRETLLQAGVPSMRIFVRTLGSPSDGSAADRVDIVPMQPVDRPPKTAQSP
jgi:outer membrane protein OmpA-like peptidoglycan-associated protein